MESVSRMPNISISKYFDNYDNKVMFLGYEFK